MGLAIDAMQNPVENLFFPSEIKGAEDGWVC
jgi:hypothetical protein